MTISNTQMGLMSELLFDIFVNQLYKKLFKQFPDYAMNANLDLVNLKKWIIEAKDYEIKSEDCVEDYCKVKLLNLNLFSHEKHRVILNNILRNNEVPQDRKIVLMEKYLYDDINDSN